MTFLEESFSDLKDPRAANASYRFGDLLLVIVAASMCGQVTATDIALFAELRRGVLSRFVSYDHPPSHDTVSRLLRIMNPEAFARAFARFADGLAQALKAQDGVDALALDGKCLARAVDAAQACAPPMMVSIFCSQSGLVRAALPTGRAGAANEVEVARAVLELIDIRGRCVTADALHSSHATLRQVTEAGADYVIALKKNRFSWWQEAQALFAAKPALRMPAPVTVHGRREARCAAVVTTPTPRAAGHAAYGLVCASRNGQISQRFYMMSRDMTPQALIETTRAHWQIESGLHWSLDVQMGEDATRARRDNAPVNIAIAKRIARNLLKCAEKAKTPISQRITKCTFSDTYLINASTHMQ